MIRDWRIARRLTQAELAKAALCQDSYITQLEKERRLPSDQKCEHLISALELSFEEGQLLRSAVSKARERVIEDRYRSQSELNRRAMVRRRSDSHMVLKSEESNRQPPLDTDVGVDAPTQIAYDRESHRTTDVETDLRFDEACRKLKEIWANPKMHEYTEKMIDMLFKQSKEF